MLVRKPKGWDGDPNTWSGKFYIPPDFPFAPYGLDRIHFRKRDYKFELYLYTLRRLVESRKKRTNQIY